MTRNARSIKNDNTRVQIDEMVKSAKPGTILFTDDISTPIICFRSLKCAFPYPVIDPILVHPPLLSPGRSVKMSHKPFAGRLFI